MSAYLDKIQKFVDSIIQSKFFSFLEHPFFSLGDFHISALIITKAFLFIYSFSLFAKFVNWILKNRIYPKLKLTEDVQYAFSVFVKYLFLAVGIVAGLNLIGIKLAAFAVFAGTLGIGIGLGLQDLAKNFISGIVLLLERPIKIGDFIEVEGLLGRVRSIKSRSTVIDTFDNTSVIVPNSEFVTQRVMNWSYSDKVIRLTVKVGVAYGSDTRLVERTLLEVAQKHEHVLKKPAAYVWFDEFGDSSLNFKLLVWIDNPKSRNQYRSDLNFAIDEAFRKNNITIPFPQRDLHLKTSDISFKS